MLEQEDKILFGNPINPSTGQLFPDEITIDSNLYKCRCIKSDLVEKFLPWVPTLYNKYNNSWYMLDVSNGGDSDRCLTWSEIKNCENLSVTIYKTSDYSDEPITYKFNGKTGLFPKLSVNAVETDAPEEDEDGYARNNLVRLVDVNGVFVSHTITILFINIIFDEEIRNSEDIADMFTCTTNNLELVRFTLIDNTAEIVFNIIKNENNLNHVAFYIKSTYKSTSEFDPDNYVSYAVKENMSFEAKEQVSYAKQMVFGAKSVDGEYNRYYIQNNYQHQYYTYETDTNSGEFYFNNNSTGTGKIEYNDIEEDKILKITGVYKHRPIISIGTHKNVNVYSLNADDCVEGTNYTISGDTIESSGSLSLPDSAKTVVNNFSWGGSMTCKYNYTTVSGQTRPRAHSSAAYFAFSANGEKYEKLTVYFKNYNILDNSITLASENDIADYKNTVSGYYLKAEYNLDESTPKVYYFGIPTKGLPSDIHLKYDGTTLDEYGRITCFLTKRFVSNSFKIVVRNIDIRQANELEITISDAEKKRSKKYTYKNFLTNNTCSEVTLEFLSDTLTISVTGLPEETSGGVKIDAGKWRFKSSSTAYYSPVLDDGKTSDPFRITNDNAFIYIYPSTFGVASIDIMTPHKDNIFISDGSLVESSFYSWSIDSDEDKNYHFIKNAESTTVGDANKKVSFSIISKNGKSGGNYTEVWYKFGVDQSWDESWTKYTLDMSKTPYELVANISKTDLDTSKTYKCLIKQQKSFVEKTVVVTNMNTSSVTFFVVTGELVSADCGESASIDENKDKREENSLYQYTLTNFADNTLYTINLGPSTDELKAKFVNGLSITVISKLSSATLGTTTIIPTKDDDDRYLKYKFNLNSSTVSKFDTADLILVQVNYNIPGLHMCYVWTDLDESEFDFYKSDDLGTTYNKVSLTDEGSDGRIALLFTNYTDTDNIYLQLYRKNSEIFRVTYTVKNGEKVISTGTYSFFSDTVTISPLDISGDIIYTFCITNAYYTPKTITLIYGTTGSATPSQDDDYQWQTDYYVTKDLYNGSAVINKDVSINYADDSTRGYVEYQTLQKHLKEVSFSIKYPVDSTAESDTMNVVLYGSNTKINPFGSATFSATSIDSSTYTKDDSGDPINFSWTYDKDLKGGSLSTTYSYYYILYKAILSEKPDPGWTGLLIYSVTNPIPSMEGMYFYVDIKYAYNGNIDKSKLSITWKDISGDHGSSTSYYTYTKNIDDLFEIEKVMYHPGYDESTFIPSEETEDYEYVDLGLPSGLMWATCNVGASSPEEYGYYFMWGSTVDNTSTTCDLTTVPYHTSTATSKTGWTKYNTISSYGTVDNLITLESSDDAVTVNMSSEWRMPTFTDVNELIENTTSEWTTLNGVNGRLFTSKNNGNTMFIPAAGNRNNSTMYNVSTWGELWTSTLYSTEPQKAYAFTFDEDDVYGTDENSDPGARIHGYSVRGVKQGMTYTHRIVVKNKVDLTTFGLTQYDYDEGVADWRQSTYTIKNTYTFVSQIQNIGGSLISDVMTINGDGGLSTYTNFTMELISYSLLPPKANFNIDYYSGATIYCGNKEASGPAGFLIILNTNYKKWDEPSDSMLYEIGLCTLINSDDEYPVGIYLNSNYDSYFTFTILEPTIINLPGAYNLIFNRFLLTNKMNLSELTLSDAIIIRYYGYNYYLPVTIVNNDYKTIKYINIYCGTNESYWEEWTFCLLNFDPSVTTSNISTPVPVFKCSSKNTDSSKYGISATITRSLSSGVTQFSMLPYVYDNNGNTVTSGTIYVCKQTKGGTKPSFSYTGVSSSWTEDSTKEYGS